MRTIEIWTEGEVVLIKAKVEKVHIEKDRETYELTDMSGEKFKHRFTKKDIYCVPADEIQEIQEEEKDSE